MIAVAVLLLVAIAGTTGYYAVAALQWIEERIGPWLTAAVIVVAVAATVSVLAVFG